jgi:hypothetical protein
MFLICLVLVAVLAGSVSAVTTVLQGETLVIDGSYSDDQLNVFGTLQVEPGADITFSGRCQVNGEGAEIIMNGGTFRILGDSSGDRLTLGDGDDATLIMNDGYFQVGSDTSPGDAGDVKVADSSGGIHWVILNGGTFRCRRMEVDGGDLYDGGRNSHLLIGGGALMVDDATPTDPDGGEGAPSEWMTVIEENTGLPILRPAEGYIEILIEDYNTIGEKATAVLGPAATNPNPDDDAENVCLDKVLEWSPGPKTQPTNGHDVYFGTDSGDVSDANTSNPLGVYRGRQSPNSYDPCGLAMSTTYYWRIDEVNDSNGESPWKGLIWSFTTNDGNAFDPDPEHDATLVPLDQILSWQAGCLAATHDVYFSTDFDEVDTMNVAALQVAGQIETTWDPCGLDWLVDYYWRVVEHGGGTFVGPVWHFQSKSKIVDPNLLIWFEMDPCVPPDLVWDSSGRQYHGDGNDFTAENNDLTAESWDTEDSHDGGGSISMDGEQSIDVPTSAVGVMDDDEVSVSLWFKGARNPGNVNWIFSVGGSISSWPVEWNLGMAIPGSDGTTVLFVAGEVPEEMEEPTEADSNDVLEWTALEGASVVGWEPDWHHFVFMKNENEGNMKIYFDGIEVQRREDVNVGTLANLKGRVDDYRVGSFHGNDTDYSGKIDDLRVFDYALSDFDVALLFRSGDLSGAWGPDPFNGASDVPRDVVLGWRAGDFASHHDVYLGTDWDDVNDAATADGESKGRKLLGDESYDPPVDLELGETYYWRIDEVNEANEPDDLWKGDVWTFTVANFLIIDDFESYDSATNKIFDTWEDGNVNLTGSFIDLGAKPFDPAHGGNQSMQYVYDNTIQWDFEHYWSECGLPFASPQDFTEGGVKALSLYFYGDPDNDVNDTEQLYVALKGSLAEVRYTDDAGLDMNDLKLQEWTEWNIELTEFSGVDPCAVTGLLIGFGDRTNTDTAGGEGIAYFDDIRLYLPRCVSSLLKPALDLSNNCIVDWADVRLLAGEWLRKDAFLSVSAPSPGPVGHWALDGDATDSSANANHGTANGTYAWIGGHIGSGAIEFTGDGGRVLVPDAAELRPASDTVSVTAWINIAEDEGTSRIVVKGGDNIESYALELGGDEPSFYVGDPCGERYFAESEDSLVHDEWIHFAGTYDGSVANCYVNAQVVGANDTAIGIELSQDPNGLGIGNRSDANDRPFIGRIDDVQVYNYGLSAEQVAHIATQTTGYMPLLSKYNIYDAESQGKKAINTRDLALLFNSWLETKYWPQ